MGNTLHLIWVYFWIFEKSEKETQKKNYRNDRICWESHSETAKWNEIDIKMNIHLWPTCEQREKKLKYDQRIAIYRLSRIFCCCDDHLIYSSSLYLHCSQIFVGVFVYCPTVFIHSNSFEFELSRLELISCFLFRFIHYECVDKLFTLSFFFYFAASFFFPSLFPNAYFYFYGFPFAFIQGKKKIY